MAVVGRSDLVGKPLSLLLDRENCTVTLCHSGTHNLQGILQNSDIVISCIGIPHFIKGDWLAQNSTVIDVGINYVALASGGTKLVGDVDFESASEKCAYLTPVPGGVGPMTVAMLMRNIVKGWE